MAAEPQGMSDRRKTAAFLTVVCSVVLEVADSTIVNTALPAIRQALGASSAEMQWIVAAYLLALGSLMLLGGRMGDALGHARVFLCGVAGFVTASVLCGMAQDATQLVIARALQGIAGAFMAPQTMAVVQLLFTPLERVTKLAYFGVIVGLAAIIGPVVGGSLIELNVLGLGWRVIFLINLPIGLGILVSGYLTLPRAEQRAEARFDPLGALIFVGAFGGMLTALIQGAEFGWGAGLVVLGLAGVALLVLGWSRAKRRRLRDLPSIIEPALFAIPTFRWATVAGAGYASSSVGFLLVFAVTLQEGLGRSALDTALVHIPFGAGAMLGVGLLGPRLLPRFGKALPLVGGVLMLGGVIATLLLLRAGFGDGPLLWAVLALTGTGMGTLSGPLGPIVVADVPRSYAGTASATFRTAQQIGGAAGIALIGGAYFSTGSDAAARLAGTVPVGVVVVALLVLAVIAVARLPKVLFQRH